MPKVSDVLASGVGGILPMLLAKEHQRQAAQDEEAARLAKSMSVGNVGNTASAPGQGMKKGGKVSASKRADGIAKRGKTRGKMV